MALFDKGNARRRDGHLGPWSDTMKGALVVCTGVYLAPLGDSNTVMPRGGGLC